LLENIIISKQKTFRTVFLNASDDALDLLQKLLQFNPKKRITIDEALNHPFISEFRNQEEEIICQVPFTFEMSDELLNEIKQFKENCVKKVSEEIVAKSKTKTK
jgi:mitogen-activated protein kinase 15